jgi:hypothetical protein
MATENPENASAEWPEWSIGRTRDDHGRPNWWRATRKRQLTRHEEYQGLAATVFGETAAELQNVLEQQARLEAKSASEPVVPDQIALRPVPPRPPTR